MTIKKTKQIGVRFDEKTVRQLEKEAEKEHRKLADYIRYLVETHPRRKEK